MRVCRFGFDEMVLTGFYADDHVIPIDQAAEAYSRDTGVELLLPSTEDLLDLLPPDGMLLRSRLRAVRLGRAARPARPRGADDPDLGRPAAGADRQPAQDALPGGQLRQARRRARRDGRRARGDVSLCLHEAAEHDADAPRRPDRDPAGFARPDRLGMRAGHRDRPALPARRRGRGDGLHRRLHDRQRHQRPLVQAQPEPQAARARQVFRLAARQVARHVLPDGPVHPFGRRGPRPAGAPDEAHRQRPDQARRLDGRDDFPGAGDRVVPLGVRHASAGRRDRDRHSLGRRLGDRDIPQARRLRAGDHRPDRHAGESGRSRGTTTDL